MQFFQHKSYKKSQAFNQKYDFSFQLLDAESVLMTGKFTAFTEEVKVLIHVFNFNIWQQNQGQYSNYDGDLGWTIPKSFEYFVSQLKYLQSNIVIKELPSLLQQLYVNVNQISWKENGKFQKIQYDNVKYNSLDILLHEKLYQYQKECIDQGVKFQGRILIADEMGVGKTLESLALASIFQYAWPLLIVCPSALRLNWQDEIIQWLRIPIVDIQIINHGKDEINQNAKIIIVSYDLCQKMKEVKVLNLIEQKILNCKFQISIADECHYLKSPKAIRSKVCMPILRQCKHVILLTGTPALAKPKDIYNHLNILRPDIFQSFNEFGQRYCDPKQSKFTNGIDFNGASNLKELHFLLKNYIMIRRLKKDVLSQLPEKRRIKVRVPGDPVFVTQISSLMNKLENIDIQKLMNNLDFHQQENSNSQIMSANEIIGNCYILTGQAKINSIKDYITNLIENNIKFLFFAHHLEVLDSVQEYCTQKNVEFIRIDGNVSAEQKHFNVQRFQKCDEVKIAILSLTAANTGITLTAASTIVFGEMHWTPAVMLQAEDRAHRIGQQECVDCHYLIGDRTIDEQIYHKIEVKFNTVSNFIDGKNANFEALIGSDNSLKPAIKEQKKKQQCQNVQIENISTQPEKKKILTERKEQQKMNEIIEQQIMQHEESLSSEKQIESSQFKGMLNDDDFNQIAIIFEKHQQDSNNKSQYQIESQVTKANLNQQFQQQNSASKKQELQQQKELFDSHQLLLSYQQSQQLHCQQQLQIIEKIASCLKNKYESYQKKKQLTMEQRKMNNQNFDKIIQHLEQSFQILKQSCILPYTQTLSKSNQSIQKEQQIQQLPEDVDQEIILIKKDYEQKLIQMDKIFQVSNNLNQQYMQVYNLLEELSKQNNQNMK